MAEERNQMLIQMAIACAIAALLIGAMYAFRNGRVQALLNRGKAIDWRTALPSELFSVLFLIALVINVIGLILWLFGLGPWALIVFNSIFVAWLLSGYDNIDQGEQASLKVFGKATRDLEPGLIFAPPGLSKINRETSATMRFVIGALMSREGEPLPTETVGDEIIYATDQPMFVSFVGKDKAQNKLPNENRFDHTGEIKSWVKARDWHPPKDDDDPLQDPINCAPVVAVLVRVSSMSRFERSGKSIENALGNMARVAEGVLNQFSGKNTLRFCMSYTSEVLNVLKRQMEWLVGDPDAIQRFIREGHSMDELKYTDQWGMDIIEVAIPYWGLSYNFNQSQQKAATSRYEKQAGIQAKMGEAKGIELVGNATAEVAKKMAAEGNPELAFKLRAIEETASMMPHAKAIVISGPSGFADLMAQGLVLGQNLSNLGGKTDEGKETTEGKDKGDKKGQQGAGGKPKDKKGKT